MSFMRYCFLDLPGRLPYNKVLWEKWGVMGMNILQLPAFGETHYADNQINDRCRVVQISDASEEAFDAYCRLLEEKGFAKFEYHRTDDRVYAAFSLQAFGVFVNYYAGVGQLQLVTEENCSYFSYTDEESSASVTPRLTQLFLCDYGMSYVLRLSDGRLIIIDGANVYEKDVDNLFARLKKDSPFQKPVIAAWIFTHPHSDHYFCFFPFMDKFGDVVEIQKFFFHFPKADDLAHYPNLSKTERVFPRYSGEEGLTSSQILSRFYRKVAQLGTPVYTPHAGQRYLLGDATVQFYSTMDDTIHCSQNINTASLMFTIDIAGQRIFFGGDGSFGDSCLAERYGHELKSDILQFPHHGFGCGGAEEQIRGLRLIAPKVCVLPVEQDLAYRTFTTYREGTNYMMTRLGIEELITGKKEHTLELPYTPSPDGILALQQNYQRGRDDAGARTWVFSQLNTGNEEDFWFSFLNTTYLPAKVTAELYFENMEKQTLRVTFPCPRLGVYRLHCLQQDPKNPAVPELPKNKPFTVRFLSDIPIVVSHENHTAAYHSSVI